MSRIMGTSTCVCCILYVSPQVRAAMFLSYLCDESGKWQPPCVDLTHVADRCKGIPPPAVSLTAGHGKATPAGAKMGMGTKGKV